MDWGRVLESGPNIGEAKMTGRRGEKRER